MRTNRRQSTIARVRSLLVALAATGAALACVHLPAAQAKTAPNCAYGTYCYAPPGWTTPGCSSGYFCVYNGSTFASGVELRYYNYGIYNFHSQYGHHLLVNRNYEDRHESPFVSLCPEYNGYGEEISYIADNDYQVENLTPVNSFIMGIPGDPVPPSAC